MVYLIGDKLLSLIDDDRFCYICKKILNVDIYANNLNLIIIFTTIILIGDDAYFN